MATPFETFVNNEIPTTLRAVIPLSGNLPAGMAMVSTGTGLNTEPKLVTTFDATYTRIVGTDPGDYATIADALASLPAGLNDLTLVTTNPSYVIYLRANQKFVSYNMDPGTVLPDVCRLAFKLLAPDTYLSGAGILFPPTSTITSFGMKFRGNSISYGTTIPNSLSFDNVSVTMIASTTTIVDDGVDVAAILVELANSSQGLYNINYYSSTMTLSLLGITLTIPKTIRHTYITSPNGAYATPRISMMGPSRLSVSNGSGAVSIGVKAIGIDSDKYYDFYLGDLSAVSAKTPALPAFSVTATSNLEATLVNNTISDTYGNDAQTYRLLLNCHIAITYGYNAGVVNNAKMTIFRFAKRSGPTVDLSNTYIQISSYNTNNIIQLDNLTILDLINDTPISVNVDGCASASPTFQSIPGSKIGGKFTLVKMIHGWLRIANSALTNCGYKILGNTQVLVDGSDGVGNLIGNNLSDNIATTNQLVNRVANKTTQSPLAPAAPQPGDLWIKVKEQY